MMRNFELFSVDIRSNRMLRLTNNSANDVSPTYISSTDQIGYISDQNNAGIYIIDRFGENFDKILFDENTVVDYPDWSVDGNYIVESAKIITSDGQIIEHTLLEYKKVNLRLKIQVKSNSEKAAIIWLFISI